MSDPSETSPAEQPPRPGGATRRGFLSGTVSAGGAAVALGVLRPAGAADPAPAVNPRSGAAVNPGR
jgi:hypothetical protein